MKLRLLLGLTIKIIFISLLLCIAIIALLAGGSVLYSLFDPHTDGVGFAFLIAIVAIPIFIVLIMACGYGIHSIGRKVRNSRINIINEAKINPESLPFVNLFLQKEYVFLCILIILLLISLISFGYVVYKLVIVAGFISILIITILSAPIEGLGSLVLELLKVFLPGFISIGLIYIVIIYYYNFKGLSDRNRRNFVRKRF